jgi:hypothetical protein
MQKLIELPTPALFDPSLTACRSKTPKALSSKQLPCKALIAEVQQQLVL